VADIQFNNVASAGTFDVQVLDNNGNPNTVLEADQDFQIQAQWQIDALTASILGGQWEVAAYVESIGPGPEQLVGQQIVPVNGGTNYSATVTVPANTLPNNPAPPQSGAYKLVTVLTHSNFGATSNVAALVEGPLLRIG
jgi:hypothetical protein